MRRERISVENPLPKLFQDVLEKKLGSPKSLCWLCCSVSKSSEALDSRLAEAEAHGEAGRRSGPLLGLQVTMPLKDGDGGVNHTITALTG